MTDGTSRAVPGVLAYQDVKAAVRRGWLGSAMPLEERQFQPASLDLRLGLVAYQLRASFLPFRKTIRERLDRRQIDFTEPELVIDTIPLEHGATLQRDVVYLCELLEFLDLPPGIRGRSNPKSTTGSSPTRPRASTRSSPGIEDRSSWRSRRARFRSACRPASR